MEIKTKFNVGDKIYTVKPAEVTYPKKRVTCDVCDSTGEIVFKDRRFICPKCHGTIETCSTGRFRYSQPDKVPKTVGVIKVEYGPKGFKSAYMCKYMCEETGLYTGINYMEDRCFSTYEEAMNFVDKKNKEFEDVEIKEYGHILPEMYGDVIVEK